METFIKNLYKYIESKDWEKLIALSNQEHIDEQFDLCGSKENYILNNLQIYSHWSKNRVISNSLDDIEGDQYAKLNQIKKLNLIGFNSKETSDSTKSYYGYVELENRLILSVIVSITNKSGKYELTGPVG